MRILATIAMALVAVTLVHAEELKTGAEMPMPSYEMINVEGETVTLADIKGKEGTVVAFWCNHCPYVKQWRSRYLDLAKEYQGKGFGFIAVNSNDPEKSKGDSMEAMQKEVKTYDYPINYVVDEGSKLAKAFGATHTPHIFVFNEGGKLVYVGAIDDNAGSAEAVKHTYLKDALDALAAGEEIKTARIPSLGCTIKWYN